MELITNALIKSLEQIMPFIISEDIGTGDITTEALDLDTHHGKAKITVKQDIILCGLPCIEYLLKKNSCNSLESKFKDGDFIPSGEEIVIIKGNLSDILRLERICLNILQQLSGIASLTYQFIQQIPLTNKKTKILDTRKTTLGMRVLEKYAVKMGGGTNHRMGLYDMYMIKDNHIVAAGGISSAVKKILSCQKINKKIEVECKTLKQVKESINLPIQVIMLDNMSLLECKDAMKIIPPHIQTEISGDMTLNKVAKFADLNPDFISVGAITHSSPNVNISMSVENKN